MTWNDLNWLDIALLLIVGGSVVMSLWRGFSRELIGLAATVFGIVAGVWFYGMAGSFLLPFVSTPAVANFCGFLIVFLGIQLLGSLLGWVVRRLLKQTGLSWIDRLLGGLFGLSRGLLVAVALVLALLAFAPGARSGAPPESIVQSRTAPYVLDAARLAAGLAPREFKDEVRLRYKQIHQLWERAATRP